MFSEKKVDKTRVVASPIRVFEAFAGIGAQHKAISSVNEKLKKTFFKIVGTSEWDARAIIAYARIHHNAKFEKQIKIISKWAIEKIDDFLKNHIFSLNSKTPSRSIKSKSLAFKVELVAANIVNNNFPDIRSLSGENLKNVDLLTYSFPCQGLSVANMGRDKGINNENSTSHLIYEIERLLKEAKANHKMPAILLMENVCNLLSKKHADSWNEWLKRLVAIGYKTEYIKLNSVNHGSLQKRKRIFAISVLKKTKFQKEIVNAFKNLEQEKNILSLPKAVEQYKIIFSSSSFEEKKTAIARETPSRIRMTLENKTLINPNAIKETNSLLENLIFLNTLTTKQDRHPNIGMIKHFFEESSKPAWRFVTTREAYLIMNFTNEDYNRVMLSAAHLTKESLYRQAGNSIVVPVLESIFHSIARSFIYEG